MLLWVTGPLVTDVSKYCIAFIFRIRLFEKTGLFSLKMEALRTFEMLGTTNPTVQLYTLEDSDLHRKTMFTMRKIVVLAECQWQSQFLLAVTISLYEQNNTNNEYATGRGRLEKARITDGYGWVDHSKKGLIWSLFEDGNKPSVSVRSGKLLV
jgi:hypothetical protein